MTQSPLPAASPPTSLIDGVESAACNVLGIKRLRHRSALRSLRLDPGVDLAELVHRIVSSNWTTGRAADNKDRSGQNWRWALQPQIGERNRSPEVVLERANGLNMRHYNYAIAMHSHDLYGLGYKLRTIRKGAPGEKV